MQDKHDQAASAQEAVAQTLLLPADAVPPALDAWLQAAGAPALVVSIERLADGRLALQAMPDLDPTIVAEIRKVLAQHADVLRRLS